MPAACPRAEFLNELTCQGGLTAQRAAGPLTTLTQDQKQETLAVYVAGAVTSAYRGTYRCHETNVPQKSFHKYPSQSLIKITGIVPKDLGFHLLSPLGFPSEGTFVAKFDGFIWKKNNEKCSFQLF